MVEVETAVAAAMVDDKPEEREEGEITSPLASRADKKHPLEHAWTFWFDNPSGKTKQQQWGNSLRSVHTVSTVEDFWCLYNNVICPSRLINGADFHCFKEGIEPKWEDPKCAYGGKWTISPPKGNKGVLDQFWLHTLLALIGEQFEEGDEICGVVVNVRTRGDKLSLWTKTASNETAQMNIGKQWKEILEIQEKIGYTFHEDAKKPQERARTRYSV